MHACEVASVMRPVDCSLPDSSRRRRKNTPPGKNTAVGCHALLQGIFWTQGSNWCLLHLLPWQAGSLSLAPPRKPSNCTIVVQSLSCVWLFVTPWTAAHQGSLSFSIYWSLLKLMTIESVIPSNRLIFCHYLLLPSIFPSIRVFSNELALGIRWPKYWCFNFSISPFNEYSGLISFSIDWFDLLAIQGNLKSLKSIKFKSINS